MLLISLSNFVICVIAHLKNINTLQCLPQVSFTATAFVWRLFCVVITHTRTLTDSDRWPASESGRERQKDDCWKVDINHVAHDMCA